MRILLVWLLCAAATCSGQDVKTLILGKGAPWATPVFINDSEVKGPTVIVTGGVHGNEPAGARAAEQIRHWPIQNGKLIVIPRVNKLGLAANTRYIPKASKTEQDLNRNFPSPDISGGTRGEIAAAVWEFVREQDPDWLIDLHEGYQFNISHKPKPGKTKSVGSSIIFDREQQFGMLAERMLAAANGLVTDPQRKFLLLGRGPKKTTLASAVIDVLKKPAMILETTFQFQRLPVRTRQHRAMMNVALNEIGLVHGDMTRVLTLPRHERGDKVYVALYADKGGSKTGVNRLASLLDAASNISVTHIDAKDIQSDLLAQFDVIVFGGGSGSEQAETIGEAGAEAIRVFVSKGGGCLGVCGGAFLCSAHYPWSLKIVDTKVFTGMQEVEGVGRKAMYLRGPTAKVKMQLTEDGRHVFDGIPEHAEINFHNGPIVSPMNLEGLGPYKPLAFFRSEQVLYPPQKGTMLNSPAIVMGEFGQGRVMSISPHPESSPGLEKMIVQAVYAVASSRAQSTSSAP